MNLVFATKEFVLKKVPSPGFPILLDEQMKSVEPANEFMRYYLTRGAIGSKASWPATGQAMYQFFSFLEVHDLDWKDVAPGEAKSVVAAYRDYCLDTIGNDRSTVRQRLFYIGAFYEYALKQRWINHLPFQPEDRTVPRDKGELAHVDATGGTVTTRDVLPKAKKKLPKFLAKSEVQALLRATSNPHHRMIIRFGLQTGLRREEIATFPLAYIFDPIAAGRTERNIRISLDPADKNGMRTKGRKERDIYISRSFLQDVWFYVQHTRGQRAQLSQTRHPQLFLNQNGEPFAASGKRLNRIVRKAAQRVGIRAWTHMLRHTYATHTLHAMQRDKSEIEPLVFLQRQLGHESINTTMVYLHIVNAKADDVVLAYDDEINDWMKEE